MNRGHDPAGRPWRRRILNVQNVNRAAAQFHRQTERNSDKRGMRQDPANGEIRPSTLKAIDRRLPRHIDGVMVLMIDFGEGFDQVNRIGFISAKLIPDGMSIDGNVKGRIISRYHLTLAVDPGVIGVRD